MNVRFITEAHSSHSYFFGREGYWPENVPPPDGRIWVYDTDKRKSECIAVRDWSFDDYMGIFRHKSDCGLVMLSLKEAKLHEHITDMHFRRCKPELVFSDEDLVQLRVATVTRELANNHAIAINYSGVCIEPHGVQGSVISFSKKSGEFGSLCSLYTLLVDLCEQTGVNLLSYERIRVYSAVRRCELVIHLSQTAEAKRFFAKMVLMS